MIVSAVFVPSGAVVVFEETLTPPVYHAALLKSSVYVSKFTRPLSNGLAVLVAWSRWLPGSVSVVAPSRKSSASPTGLLLSATVPGVLTGVVPVESCQLVARLLGSIHIPGSVPVGQRMDGDQAAATARAPAPSRPNV